MNDAKFYQISVADSPEPSLVHSTLHVQKLYLCLPFRLCFPDSGQYLVKVSKLFLSLPLLIAEAQSSGLSHCPNRVFSLLQGISVYYLVFKYLLNIILFHVYDACATNFNFHQLGIQSGNIYWAPSVSSGHPECKSMAYCYLLSFRCLYRIIY